MPADLRERLVAREALAVLGLTALAAALRFVTLADQGLWYDEYLTQIAASGSLGEVIPHVNRIEANPPLYYIVAWAWVHAFGDGDFVLRSLSALAGTLTVPVAYATGRELASRRAGIILAALVATSPLLIWYSQEARSYALLVLFSATSLYFFARARGEPTAGSLAGWSVASALALLTHYFAGALVAVEAALLLIGAPGRRREVGLALLPPVAAVLATLPTLLDQHRLAGWIAQLDLGARMEQLPRLFAVGNSYPTIAADLLVAAAAALAVVALRRTPDTRSRRGALLAGGVGILGLAVAMAAALVGEDFLIARNLLPLWLPLAGAVAIGLSVARPAWLGAGAAVALCTLYTGLTIEVFSDWRLNRIDWRAAGALVGAANGPRLVVAAGGYQAQPLPRYLLDASPVGYLLPAVGEYVTLEYDDPGRGQLCWWGGACGMPDAGVRLPVLRGLRLVEVREASGFEMRRYVLARPRVLAPDWPAGAYLVQQVP
jgi:hypothetical protein